MPNESFSIGHLLVKLIIFSILNHLKDNGVIVEIGSHEELLKKKGAYYSLINTQL